MKYLELDDNQLWELIKNEDPEALKIVYYRNYDILRNYGYKICGNEELVRDCIQDIIVKIFGNKNLKTLNQIRPYLLGALRNMICEEFSKKGTTSIEFDLSQLTLVVEENTDESEKDDETLLMEIKMIKAMNKLNNNQKQIIYLRYVQNLSFKEVAEFLDINVQSAMNLSSRSIAKLRSLLTKSNDNNE